MKPLNSIETVNQGVLVRSTLKKPAGFTLIELIITVFIIAILSAIALPSYRQYIKKNTESQVKSDILQLSGQLNQWRAKYLTYANFEPKSGYSDESSSMVTSPFEREDALYEITIFNGEANPISGASIANSWVITAAPVDTTENLGYFAMSSTGVQCFSKSSIDASKVLEDSECGAGGGNW